MPSAEKLDAVPLAAVKEEPPIVVALDEKLVNVTLKEPDGVDEDMVASVETEEVVELDPLSEEIEVDVACALKLEPVALNPVLVDSRPDVVDCAVKLDIVLLPLLLDVSVVDTDSAESVDDTEPEGEDTCDVILSEELPVIEFDDAEVL